MLVRPSKQVCGCGKPMSQVAKQCRSCKKRRVPTVCKVCGTAFQSKPSRPRAACSPACAHQLRARGGADKQSRKVDLVCERCGKTKRVSPTYADRRFCSPRCGYEHNRGENNARWKGGSLTPHQTFYTSREWALACRDIWIRDKSTCQRCGAQHRRGDRSYDVHHIVRWASRPDLGTDRSNLVLLCRGCHRFVHSADNTGGQFMRTD